MIDHAYWIVLAPLLSSLIIFFFGKFLPMRGALLGVIALGYALIHSLGIFFTVLAHPGFTHEMSMTWFQCYIVQTQWGVLIDGLSSVMLVVVTLVSFLVHIYSLGYMHDDPRFKRFYAYLSFFTFAMLFLVVSNNFLQFFIGWEIMGLASYLLIGFWFEKNSAANASKKAFITTKIGDLGFFLSILTLFSLLGTVNFEQVARCVAENQISPLISGLIALGFFWGSCGKSAQVPLHVWLPDAMEGPTPVSALIHAATMVAAGVFLVARSYFLFEHGPFSLEIVAWVGGITALLAATMALVATDFKRVLAFSTVSQLGYMMLAMGVGGRTAGMFHLTTHAFFKALLFLCAGSVIHATHTNDIREMGGLSRKMVWTFVTFTIAWLAISGVPPFSGFFSKDMILEAALESGHVALFSIALFVAFLTAFYMTRLLLLVFVTDPRNQDIHHHAHESPPSMLVPLMVLAVLAVITGAAFSPYIYPFEKIMGSHEAVHEAVGALHDIPGWFVPGLSILVAGGGILLGFLLYLKPIFSVEKIAKTFHPIHTVLLEKYGFDEAYIALFVKPLDLLSVVLAKADYYLLDQMGVDGTGWMTEKFSRLNAWFDRVIVDGLVDFWGVLAQAFGSLARFVQTGRVQNYIIFFFAGFGMLLFFKLHFTVNDLLAVFKF